MYAYLIAIIGVVLFGIMAVRHNEKVFEMTTTEETINRKKHYGFALLVAIGILIFIGGFRYYVGSDFGSYYLYSPNWELIKIRFETLDEPLLYYIAYLVRKVSDEGIWVIFIEQLITVALVAYGIWQYDDDNDLVLILLFYVLICWTSSFNGVRQAMAAAFVFAFSKKRWNNWILQYAIVCFIAFLIHRSALLMFPYLVLSQRKIDFRQIILLILLAVILPQFFEWSMNFMDLTYEYEYSTEKINILRVFVVFVPLLLLCFVEDLPVFLEKNYFIVNMVIINAIIVLVTRNSALLNRFSMYTSLYTIIYLPKALKALPDKSRQLITVCAVVLYFAFFIRETAGGWTFPTFSWSFSHFGAH